MAEAPALSACGQLVRQHDPDRFLCALFAPAARREDLFALYAFNHEVARVAELVREPMVGLIRLQWWRDALAAIEAGQPPAHPIAEALGPVLTRHRLPHEALVQLIDSREADLERQPPSDLAAFEAYLEATSSNLTALALGVLAVDAPPALEAGRRVGLAWGLTGHLRALPFHATAGRIYLPEDRLRAHGVAPETIAQGRGGTGLRRVVEEIATRAREHLAAARQARQAIPAAALPALLPAALADRYLDRLRRAGYSPFRADLRSRPALAPLELLVRRLTRRF